MDIETFAAELAGALASASNALALLAAADQGRPIDGPSLRRILKELIPKLEWIESHRQAHELVGLDWAPDAPNRTLRMKQELRAWDPSNQPTDGIFVSVAECLHFARGAPSAP